MALLRATPLIFSLTIGWSNDVLAQVESELATVQVTADRSSKPLAQAAPSSSVISRKQLDAQLSRDIAQAIKYEPGVEVANDPSRRGNAGYTIRGIDGNRILMLLDGVRLPEAYAGGGANSGAVSGRDFVELETLRRIDIVKGPSSSLYGSDAIGGVVGYHSKTVDDFVAAEEGIGGSIKGFGATADNSWGSSMGFGIKGQRSDAMLLYTQRNGHATRNQGDEDSRSTSRTTPNPQNWHSTSLLGKLGFTSQSQQRLELTLEHYRRTSDSDLLNTLSPTLLQQQASDRVQRDLLALGWEARQLGAFERLAIKVSQQKLDNGDDSSEWRSGNLRRQSEYNFEQTLSGLSLEAEQRFKTGDTTQQLLWGLDVNRTDSSRPRTKTQYNADGSSTHIIGGEVFPSKTFPDSRSQRLGLFIQDEIKFSNSLTVSPSLRWDRYTMTPQPDQAFANGNPQNYSIPAFKDSAFSPKLGISLPFNDHYTSFWQFSSGFKAPPFDDANMAFTNSVQRYQVIPNAALQSEHSHGLEWGLKGQWQLFDFTATSYYNRYRDFIDLAYLGKTNGLDTYQYQNIGAVTIKGVEGRATWRFATGWQAMANLAYSHGQDTQHDQALATIAPLSATLGLRYDRAAYGGEAFLRLVKANTRLPALTGRNTTPFKAPGYAALDLTAYWKPARETTVRAGLFNVFDQKYWRAADVRGKSSSDPALDLFTQPGRNLSASIEYLF
ncbi:TonB-dependent hemoglobin/transferrin/lactoferrin family receptor [Neisseriaceae bacterium TC5R-5]|nr:TonB-dependent hemoglobin/transferrin/lactoferrin family receptor [Neisseriaceae bacterium TC5R-5]